MNNFLSECAAIVGTPHVLTSALEAYTTDWRGRGRGHADAVIRPASVKEVALIVRLCATHQVAIITQGGNTGLVLGGSGLSLSHTDPALNGAAQTLISRFAGAIILSLSRMNQIESIDPINNSMVVQAGATLQNVQVAAHNIGRLFPLSLASQGTCTIGGNLATNAGGVHVLRYGSMRKLCLGIEVVTAQAEVLNSLFAVHKNNSGYDWRNLLIGSEGSLGVITRAVLKLFPLPKAHAASWIFCQSMTQIVALFNAAEAELGSFLCAFEIMMMPCVDLVKKYFPDTGEGLSAPYSFAVLLALEHSVDYAYLQSTLVDFLARHASTGEISDALIAQSDTQIQSYWKLRELIPQAEARAYKAIKHDIALPISALSDFVARAELSILQFFPGCTPYYFGHCGDGNLHYNVILSEAYTVNLAQSEQAINQVVYDLVAELGGSFSAEHGIGRLRVNALAHYRSPAEIALFKSLKFALDPLGILNPGVILDTAQ